MDNIERPVQEVDCMNHYFQSLSLHSQYKTSNFGSCVRQDATYGMHTAAYRIAGNRGMLTSLKDYSDVRVPARESNKKIKSLLY